MAIILAVMLYFHFLRSLIMGHAADNVLIMPLLPLLRLPYFDSLLSIGMMLAKCFILNELRKALHRLGLGVQWACMALMAVLLLSEAAAVALTLLWRADWDRIDLQLTMQVSNWVFMVCNITRLIMAAWLATALIMRFAGWLRMAGWAIGICLLAAISFEFIPQLWMLGGLTVTIKLLVQLLPYVALCAAFTGREEG